MQPTAITAGIAQFIGPSSNEYKTAATTNEITPTRRMRNGETELPIIPHPNRGLLEPGSVKTSLGYVDA